MQEKKFRSDYGTVSRAPSNKNPRLGDRRPNACATKGACPSSNASPTSARAAGRTSSSAWRRPSGRRRASACSTTPSDASHNRSVFTLAGDAAAVKAAIAGALRTSRSTAIDLRQHRGEHPRLGAVDVVPFVPIEGVTMAECVALAKDVGAAVAERFHVPVYLYEEASANPARKNLEDIRRGEFEGLAAKMAHAGWAPDFGPATPHAVGRRVGHRRAHAAHRLQHQPRHRPPRRGEEDRGGHPPQQRRAALREGDGHRRSRSRHRRRCR